VLSFASDLGKLHQECIKCSRQLSMTVPWEEHRLLNGFLNSNVGKFQMKIVSIQIALHRSHR
jgi:hypothetical protein